MPNNQNWGDTAFGVLAGVTLICMTLGFGFAAVLWALHP